DFDAVEIGKDNRINESRDDAAERIGDIWWPINKEGTDSARPTVASALLANMSMPTLVAQRDDVGTEVLTDPDAGWGTEWKTGGMDVDAESMTTQSTRGDVLAWAMAGQRALGAPQTNLGAGTRKVGGATVLTTPRPAEWATLAEVRTAARRGDGDQWRRQMVTEHQSFWKSV